MLTESTYHFTGGEFVVCDLQGGKRDATYVLTDPVVWSKDRRFGATDLGPRTVSSDYEYGAEVCTRFRGAEETCFLSRKQLPPFDQEEGTR